DLLRRITVSQVLGEEIDKVRQQIIKDFFNREIPILKPNDPLSKAVELMASSGGEHLPVVLAVGSKEIIGLLTYKNELDGYKWYHKENQEVGINLSLKRQRLKMMIRSRQLMDKTKG